MKIVINPIRPALSDLDQDFHVLVRLQSEPKVGFKRTPLNLAVVVDRSGSMEGTKLTEAKRCVLELIKRMNPEDHVGIVQYDNQVDTVLPLSPVSEIGSVVETLIQGITANANTDLHAGWLRGGEMLAPTAGQDTTCHVILLSDGQANSGITDADRICKQISALAEAGVTTTTIGLGADFNEVLMTAMAQAGQGNAHYGERAVDLSETFDAEIGLLSQLQWRNVKLSMTNNADDIKVINSYERTEDEWRMPSVAMGSECWMLIRMSMKEAIRCQNEHGSALTVKVQAVDSSGQLFNFQGQLNLLPITTETEYAAMPAHELVERRMKELSAAQLQLQIRNAALAGNWIQVEQLLSQLETMGKQEPWIAASIAFTRQLMSERDESRMSKEMLYKSRKMNNRLSSTDEMIFSMQSDLEEQAFLRRKSTEGRRSET